MRYRIDDLKIPEDDPLKYDMLGWKELVEFLSGLIGRLNGPFVMALDAPWGSGKTTLVRMLKAILEKEQFRCMYFNAWKVDYAADPLIAMVSAIDRIDPGVPPDGSGAFRKYMGNVKKCVPGLLRRTVVAAAKIGTMGILDVDAMTEKIIGDEAGELAGDIINVFTRESDLLKKFKEELGKAVEQLHNDNKKPNLVFFIDELDRCRPTFAIELLERVKHLFDIPNIVFVLSVDKQQLEASVKAVYGAESNAPEYLRRFIDLEYGIPAVPTDRYTEKLIEHFGFDSVFEERKNQEFRSDKSHLVEFFTRLANAMSLSLRARERCMTRLRTVIDQTTLNGDYLDPILVALLLVLRSNKEVLFRDLVSGKASAEEVMEVLASLPGSKELLADRRGSIIHAYLLAADPVRDRAREQQQLEERKGRGDTEAVEILEAMDEVKGNRSKISLSRIAAKIDLAAQIRE